MTLGSLKEYAVQLIDEFSNKESITTDEDIKVKLNNLFNMGQIELSQAREIIKVFNYELKEKPDKKYFSIEMPMNCKKIKKIRYFSNNDSKLEHYIQKNSNQFTVKVKSNCLGDYEIEYASIPKIIDTNTLDSYEFEIDLDSQMSLPYYVASDVLMSDVASDYTSFEAKYRNKLEILNSLKEMDTFITIEENNLL